MKKTALRQLSLAISVAAGTLAAATAQAGGFAFVTNGENDGHGSLRHALEVQQANYVIVAPYVSAIAVDGTLEYSSESPLTLIGTGQTISLPDNQTILAITQGANLRVSNLAFEGLKDFYSITNRGDLDGPAGKGIFVDVRDDQTGTVYVILNNVRVAGVANHGIHVSDCSLADDCGGGSGGAGDGSPASIYLAANNVTVTDAGNGKFDADGIRVDDRGAGSIYFTAFNSTFSNVGADGVELDEGDAGDVVVQTIATRFIDNGGYCDPILMASFIPSPDEAEFDESEQVAVSDIPGPVTGSPDDSCIEREVDLYDSGFVEAYEFGLDLDDGIDLDEAGEGGLYATMRSSLIVGNLDEGVDFDEEGDGNVQVAFLNTEASDNTDDGFKVSEEDGGGVEAYIRGSAAKNNGGKGIVLEEADAGNLEALVLKTTTYNNDDSDNTGIEAVQEDEGTGTLRVRRSSIADGIDTDGVEEI
ncbi:MAG: hypothetical protein R3208_20240 [Ketobacteraceae bacterium]|nr:hypothetical protein [Ketobacteraceae bacterium]